MENCQLPMPQTQYHYHNVSRKTSQRDQLFGCYSSVTINHSQTKHTTLSVRLCISAPPHKKAMDSMAFLSPLTRYKCCCCCVGAFCPPMRPQTRFLLNARAAAMCFHHSICHLSHKTPHRCLRVRACALGGRGAKEGVSQLLHTHPRPPCLSVVLVVKQCLCYGHCIPHLALKHLHR